MIFIITSEDSFEYEDKAKHYLTRTLAACKLKAVGRRLKDTKT